MKLIYTLCLAALFFSSNSFAGTGASTPFYTYSAGLRSSVKHIDELLTAAYAENNNNPFFESKAAAVADSKSGWFAKGAKFCSCQILHMSSSNYNHQQMAVFAEKTNRGEGTEISTARNRIEKEKKKIKAQFYDKVKVVAEITAPVSCNSLYKNLKLQNKDLQVFDMLDADIR